MQVSILILIVIFGLSIWAFENFSVREQLLLQPYRVAKNNFYVYSLLTSGFVHSDWPHLIFNSVTFYFFVVPLESIVGSESFVAIYFGSLLISVAPDMISERSNPNFRTLGASGAISGSMFAFILYEPTSSISLFLLPIGIPAPIFAVLFLAYTYFASKRGGDNINHNAHLWGAIAGMILAIVLDPDVLSNFLKIYFK